jgi:ferredoxin
VSYGFVGKKEKKTVKLKHKQKIRYFLCQGFGHYARECPNKRIMFIKDDGEVESTSEDDLEGMSKLDDCSDMEYVAQRESMIIRRSLSVQVYERM